MRMFTVIYMALAGLAVGGAAYASFSGALLPAADGDSTLSLKSVENRRTHFVRNYSLGK